MQQPHGHTLKAFDQDMAELRGAHHRHGRVRRSGDRGGDALPRRARRDGGPRARRSRRPARRARGRGRASRRRADRASRADGRRPARSHRRAQDRRRGRADRRLCQEHRAAGPAASDEAARSSRCRCFRRWRKIASAMVHDVLARLRRPRSRQGEARVSPRRRGRRLLQSIFRTLLTYMMEDPQNIGPSTTCCSSPRTSSGSATMRPTSRRWSITRRPASGSWTAGIELRHKNAARPQ